MNLYLAERVDMGIRVVTKARDIESEYMPGVRFHRVNIGHKVGKVVDI